MEYTSNRRLSFAQRVHGYVTGRKESQGQKSRGSALNIRWGARFAPPKNTTTKLRLLPGCYKGLDGNEYEYFQYVQFFSARTKRGFISSANWEINNGQLNKVGGDCLGYDEWKKELDEGVEANHRTVSMRVMHVFNAIHLDWHHLVPAVDDKGNEVVYKHGDRKGEVILSREQCAGRRCDFCKDKYEKVFGKKVHWSIGLGHLSDLAGVIDEISKDCSSCDGSGTIETISWDCEECGKSIIKADEYDVRDERQAAELFKRAAELYKCRCGHTSMLVPQYECSECDDGSPLSIFDCDIEIKRQGEGTQSSVQVPRWTRTELSDELKEMAKPWNLPEIFSPDPSEFQAKALKCKNPYGGKGDKEAKDYADYDK